MARVDTLSQVPFPLPDPSVVLQHLWITQGGRDFSVSPTRLGFVQQSSVAPVNPFAYQLWWDLSALPSGSAVLRAYVNNVWVEIGPFGDQFGNVTVPGTLDVVGGKISGANAHGYLEIASNLQVDGGTIAGPNQGPLATASDLTVGGKLTVDGTSTLKGATTVTGGLTTDTLTTSGAATIGGTLNATTLTLTGAGTGATGGLQANTATFSGFVTVNGTLTANSGFVFKGGATGDTLTLNGAAPQITLDNGTSNWIQYSNAGVSPPTLTSHSPGTKVLLLPTASATSYDYAIGLQFNGMWFSAGGFYFYGLAGSPAQLAVANDGSLSIISPTTTITGNANINNLVPSSGAITLTGTLSATLDLNASREVTTNTFHANSDASIGGNASIAGNEFIGGNASIVGSLGVGGILDVSGLTTAVGGLVVQAATTLAGGLSVSGVYPGATNTLIVNGPSVVNGSSEITGPLVVDGINSTFRQGLVVTAASGDAVALESYGGFVANANASSAGVAGTFNGAVTILAASGPPQALYVNGSINCSTTGGQGDAIFAQGTIQATGNVIANGSVLTSDRRLKTDIAGFNRGIAEISRLRPVRYRMIATDTQHYGLIADDVETVIPEAVGEHDGKKTLDIMAIIATLINTVRELGDEIKALKDGLDQLQSRTSQ